MVLGRDLPECGVPCRDPPQSAATTVVQLVAGTGTNPLYRKLAVMLTMNWLARAIAVALPPPNMTPIAGLTKDGPFKNS